MFTIIVSLVNPALCIPYKQPRLSRLRSRRRRSALVQKFYGGLTRFTLELQQQQPPSLRHHCHPGPSGKLAKLSQVEMHKTSSFYRTCARAHIRRALISRAFCVKARAHKRGSTKRRGKNDAHVNVTAHARTHKHTNSASIAATGDTTALPLFH